MSLLREIQELATDDKVSLTVVLRKCKVLAARLKHQPFSEWIDKELNGYESIEGVPSYRFVRTHSFGTLMNPVRQINNAPIPAGCMPEKYQEFVEQEYLLRGIATYEAIVKDKSGSEELRLPWPANLIALVADKVYTNMNLVAAWKILTPASIAGMLDAVRNRVLSFVLEIEREAPNAGEAQPSERPLPPEKVSHVFQTLILGGNAVIAAEASGFTQNTITVERGNLESLRAYFAEIGIEKNDLDELQEAIEAEKKPESPRKLGSRVSAWIGKMVGKAAGGAWGVATSSAADLLTKAISSYYGWPL